MLVVHTYPDTLSVKVLTRNLNAFLNKPPDHILAVLIYGKDTGLVHERVLRITRAVVEDPADPFRVSELGSSEITSDPSRLTDEFTAQCLVGGKRVVRIRLGSENISDSLRALIELPKQNALIVVEAGFLSASSSVRRFMEKEAKTAVIPCYQDTTADLSSLISEITKPQGLKISSTAKNYLLNHLGSDRMVSRSELEKLVLFVGPNASVSIEDVVAIIGDSSALSIEKLVYAATGGNRDILNEILLRTAAEGFSTIALLRATQRHLHRLLQASEVCAGGKTASEAMKVLRPPVMFMFAQQFLAQLGMWTPSLIGTALELLTNAEIQCKSTGLPQNIIGERALLRLSQIGKKM